LFDARFQLISGGGVGVGDGGEVDENTREDSLPVSAALKFLEAPSDLVPGVYEGGLKTWECSVDLVDYLNSTGGLRDVRGKRVMEVCSEVIFS
jgi:protein-histidine N-methyltransferase